MKKRPTALYLTFCVMLFMVQTAVLSAASAIAQEDPQADRFLDSVFRPCWKFESGNLTENRIASDNEKIFIPLTGGKLNSLDLSSGNILWQSDLGGNVISNPAVTGAKLYVITSVRDSKKEAEQESQEEKNTASIIREIDTKTGITNWQKTINARQSAYIFPSDIGLIVIDIFGHLTVLDTLRQTSLLEQDFNLKVVSNPQFRADNRTINFITSSAVGKILSISVQGGSIKYEADIKNASAKAFAGANERMFWGDQSGNVYGFNLQSKSTLWKTRFGGEISSIQTHKNGLLVTSHDNFAYLLDGKSGDRLWKRRLGGRILGAPIIKGDSVLFATVGGSNLTVIEMESGRVINQIALPENFELIGPPTLAGNQIILSGNQGIHAYGNGSECLQESKHSEK